MCDCEIYDRDLKPVKVDTKMEHTFTYTGHGIETVLLDKIRLAEMNYNHAFCKKVKDVYGCKQGYLFFFGEKEQEDGIR